jgi:hypothetical protein
MAELRVEKKSPVWPWILVAVLVIGVVAWLIMSNNADSTGDRNDGRTDTDRTEQRDPDRTVDTR